MQLLKAYFFISRMAFLLNLAFLAGLLLRMGALELPQELTAGLIAAGWVLSPAANGLVHAGWLFYRKCIQWNRGNRWLPVSNAVIFALQIVYFFF